MLSYSEFEEKYFPNEICLNVILDGWYLYFKENAEVGDGATVCYWSDRHAYTIIKRTAQSLTLQQDNATLSPEFTPEFISGGFCAHCTNQHEQKYTYEPNPEGSKIIARWSKKNNGFYWRGLRVIPGRHEFYDYNF